tara:strand:- start:335 stop:523 length:189 start_codon:yes stop_codon:yes gene_type:complete
VSEINVISKPSFINSNEFNLAPCNAGLVSVAIILIFFLFSTAALITPTAVPYPTVASAPVFC